MAARASGEPLDIERRGRISRARIEGASVRVLGSIDHFKDRLDAFETRPARIGPVPVDKIDYFGGRVDAGFDAAPFSTVVFVTSSSAGAISEEAPDSASIVG